MRALGFAVAFVGLVAACSGGTGPVDVPLGPEDESPAPSGVDAPHVPPGGNGSGNPSASGNPAGSGSSGSGSSSSGSGSGSSSSSASSSGAGCTTCASAINGGDTANLCPGADTPLLALFNCVCASACSTTDCNNVCNNGAPPDSLCNTCGSEMCPNEYAACQAQ